MSQIISQHKGTGWSAFSLKHLFIEASFHQMAGSSNAQFHLVFKTVSRISVALLKRIWTIKKLKSIKFENQNHIKSFHFTYTYTTQVCG